MRERRAVTRQPAPIGKGGSVLTEVLTTLSHLRIMFPNTARERRLKRITTDLIARSEMGTVKYGTELRTQNGRSARLDMYQEVLDAMMYSQQGRMEGDTVAGTYLEMLVLIAENLAGALDA